MAKRAPSYLVPFSTFAPQLGSILHYADRFPPEEPGTVAGIDWRKPEPFTVGPLLFAGFTRGRSAALATFTADTAHYPVMLHDLADMLRSTRLSAGVLGPGLLVPVKRGCNYGVRLPTPEEIAQVTR